MEFKLFALGDPHGFEICRIRPVEFGMDRSLIGCVWDDHAYWVSFLFFNFPIWRKSKEV